MQRQKAENQDIKLSGSEGKLEGRYANYIRVGYNAFEFLFDFGQHYFENEQAMIFTRVIITPNYAKDLLDILQCAIEGYEGNHGKIEVENKLIIPNQI